MRKILITLFTAFCLSRTYGQLSPDSIFQELNTNIDDSSRADDLSSLSLFYESKNPDTALLLAQQALTLAKYVKFEAGEAQAMYSAGRAFKVKGNYAKALEMFLQSLKMFEAIKMPDWVAANLLFIGQLYESQGDYAVSLSYYFKARALYEQYGQDYGFGYTLLYIADNYEKLNKPDSAILCIQQINKLHDQTDISYHLTGRIFNILGNIYAKKGDFSVAMNYYRQSIPVLQKSEDDRTMCQTTLGMGRLFKSVHNDDSSFYYANRSLQIAQKAGFALEVLNAADFLTDFFKRRNHYDSAFIYQEISNKAKDSLFSREKVMGFQNEAFNEQLQQQQLEALQQQLQSKIKMYSLLVLLAVFLLIAFMLWRNNRHKQKKYLLEIEKQYREQLLQSQLETQEYSFNQISQELHDNIGQLLSSAKLLLGIAAMELSDVPDTLKTADQTVSKAILDLRSLSKSLSKEWLHQFNLIENLEAEKDRINAARNIEVSLISQHEKLQWEPEAQVMLFRVIQEALQNSIKHAFPKHIIINIKNTDAHLELSIEDDGRGFNIASTKKESLGLRNMEHRIQLLGGTIEWKPGNEKGTVVVIVIPKRE